MTTRFRKLIAWIIKWEGTEFEDDPDDPGGATKFGIDQRSHPKVNIRALTLEQATEIYFEEYWRRYGCEALEPGYGEVWMNCCVNCGIGRARKIESALGGRHSWGAFLDEQEAFYRRLVLARPSSRKYLKGWLARTADLRRFVANL